MKTKMLSMIAGILMSVVLVNSENDNSAEDKTIYTFIFGTRVRPFEFLSKSGDLMGFSVDIVRKVCELANKKCAFILSNTTLCWDNKRMMGEGLNNRYWDVCSAYAQTKERMLVYGFMGKFAEENPAYVFARAGTKFTKYHPDFHHIGFSESSRLNPVCVNKRLGVTVPDPRYYESHESLVAGLENCEIDVAFTMEATVMKAGAEKFRKVSDRIRCGENGFAFMMRKDVVPKYEWFDATLRDKVLKSKYYTQACNIAKLAYGGDPACLKLEDID